MGGEDGLFCVELNKETVMKVGEGKKIEALEFVHDEQLLIVMGGKQLFGIGVRVCRDRDPALVRIQAWH